VDQGESPAQVARILGVARGSVHRWRQLARLPDGLAAKPARGPTPRLSDDQLRQLEALLLQGAHHHGWRNQLWSADRVAQLIRRRFGIRFHPEHVRKLLKRRLGWTSQKPRRHPRERDDKECERWKADEWPRILREAFARRAHVVCLDEAGFSLTPSVRRTLAPRGQTPVVDAWDRRDRLAAISCITLSPRVARPGLYFALLPKNQAVHAEDVVAFLRQLREELPGPFTVVWDRSTLHRKSKRVGAWLARHPEVVTEDFPGYAPELNPDEWVWSWTKYGRLANLGADTTEALWEALVDEWFDLKHRPRLLASFLMDAGLPLVYR
jgi:transposase